MKKSLLTSAVAVALGLSSFNALAIDIDAGTGAATYASEINGENVTSLNGTALDTTVQLGFGFSTSNSIAYARYDLIGGTWAAALASSDLTGTTGSATLSQGGTVAGTSVVFNITAGTAGMTATDTFVLGLNTKGIKLAPGSTGVTIQYRLYTDPVAASNGTDATLKNKSATLVAFKNGLTFVTTPNTSTASVSSTPNAFTELLDRVAPQPTQLNTARIGAVNLGVASPDPVLDATGAPLSDPATILGATTTVTVAGDFTAVGTTGKVWLDTTTDCTGVSAAPTTGPGTVTVAADKQSASIVLPIVTTPQYVCYQGDGVAAFKEQVYTISMNPVVTSTDYLATKINFTDLTLGTIKRDGTELQATFTTTVAASANRFIFINTGTVAAPITGADILVNGDATATPGSQTFPVTIPAGGRVAIQMSNLLGSLSTGSSVGVKFSIGGASGNIQGTYQYKAGAAEVQTVVQMVRPGTN